MKHTFWYDWSTFYLKGCLIIYIHISNVHIFKLRYERFMDVRLSISKKHIIKKVEKVVKGRKVTFENILVVSLKLFFFQIQ